MNGMNGNATRTAIILLIVIFGCRPYNQYRQTKTIANMRAIAAELDRLNTAGRAPSEAEIEAVIKGVGNGKDAWGNRFVHATRVIGRRWLYIVVSRGSDGVLDTERLEEYFVIPPREAWSDPRRDLIIRDGNLVTTAGK